MTTYSKIKLLDSTDGRFIQIVATATPGTALHTATPTGLDEIHLWAVNSDTVARKLTVEFGSVAGSDKIEFTVPAEDGLYLIVPGLVLRNSLLVKAFAETANVINVGGFVNRIT